MGPCGFFHPRALSRQKVSSELGANLPIVICWFMTSKNGPHDPPWGMRSARKPGRHICSTIILLLRARTGLLKVWEDSK